MSKEVFIQKGKTAKVLFKGRKENVLTMYYNLQWMTIHKEEPETFLESLNSLSNLTQNGMQSETKPDIC